MSGDRFLIGGRFLLGGRDVTEHVLAVADFDGLAAPLVIGDEQLIRSDPDDHLGEQPFEPRPADVEAVLAAWRELAASINTAYEQIGQALAPWLVNLRAMLDDLGARYPELLDDPGPVDVAERALWAKQRPGRTGPPARRMDGRRGR